VLRFVPTCGRSPSSITWANRFHKRHSRQLIAFPSHQVLPQVSSHLATSRKSEMHGGDDHSETSALLHSSHQHDSDDEENSHATPILNKPTSRTRAFVGSALILLFAAALVLVLCFEQSLPDTVRPWLGLLPKEPMTAAHAILKVAPVIVSFFGSNPCISSHS